MKKQARKIFAVAFWMVSDRVRWDLPKLERRILQKLKHKVKADLWWTPKTYMALHGRIPVP